MNETSWRRFTEVPLLVASLAYLVAYSWRVIADLSGTERTVATSVIAITWAMFIVDYLVRLLLAPHKRHWFRTNLAALAFALVPVLRLVRLLRALTYVPGIRTSAGDRLRAQILVYGIGAALILIYLSSLAVLEAERHAPDADITTFGIAVWWSCVTVTTTGYGDYIPVTDAGRLVGVGLMFGGIALSGIITATLASWVLERATRTHGDQGEPATRAQMRELMAKVEALTAAAPGPAAGREATASAPAPRTAHEPRVAPGHAPRVHPAPDAGDGDVAHDTDLGNGGDARPGG